MENDLVKLIERLNAEKKAGDVIEVLHKIGISGTVFQTAKTKDIRGTDKGGV